MVKIQNSKLFQIIKKLLALGLKGGFLIAALASIVLVALLIWSAGNSTAITQQFDLLLLLNGVLAVALFLWIISLLYRSFKLLRRNAFGARLTLRFAVAFSGMAIVPGALIYVLSVQFMSHSVESWFNVRVNSALESGLDLGRATLDIQVSDLLTRGRLVANQLSTVSEKELPVVLTQIRDNNNANDALVFSSSSNRVIAFSSSGFTSFVPNLPPSYVMSQLRVSREYARAEVLNSVTSDYPKLIVRVIVPIYSTVLSINSPLGSMPELTWLQLTRIVPENIALNLNEVQNGFRDYQELALSRTGIRKLYGITLTMAMLLTVFISIAVALAIARRLVKPLLTLAAGTQAVGGGDFRPIPEPGSKDEVAQLTRSFNLMTRQLDDARQQVERNRLQLERSNVYLESVLAGLSSGVMVFNEHFHLSMANRGAYNILSLDSSLSSDALSEQSPTLVDFIHTVKNAFSTHNAVGSKRVYWQEQITLDFAGGETQTGNEITLLLRGTELEIDQISDGYLVVFDDISEVISANRAVAWAEVARRLAHEIKNPLTPIQLSAERVAMKLSDKLGPTDAAMLNRSIGTIINQVSSLKKMVDDFREYARTPPAQMQEVDLNALVTDLALLYGWDPEGNGLNEEPMFRRVNLSLEPNLPLVLADPTQMRQVLNNLLSNARDAMEEMDVMGDEPGVTIFTEKALVPIDNGESEEVIRLVIQDRGPGFSSAIMQKAFEPYITTKHHGTGLGLPIVRKIVEEHGGKIVLANVPEGGARISILLTKLVQNRNKTSEQGL